MVVLMKSADIVVDIVKGETKQHLRSKSDDSIHHILINLQSTFASSKRSPKLGVGKKSSGCCWGTRGETKGTQEV